MDGHNDRNYSANAYPFFHTREPQMYFGDSNAMASNMGHIPFYPQGHPLSHIPLQGQNAFGSSGEQQENDVNHFQQNLQNPHQQQNYTRMQQM